MNQDYYEYIRQLHEGQLKTAMRHRSLKLLVANNPTLRMRTLLYLSDALLNLGQRIRPAEFEVHVHGEHIQESALEITAKGC
jgi:hypothetical protein